VLRDMFSIADHKRSSPTATLYLVNLNDEPKCKYIMVLELYVYFFKICLYLLNLKV